MPANNHTKKNLVGTYEELDDNGKLVTVCLYQWRTPTAIVAQEVRSPYQLNLFNALDA